jgi:hypothetical protein
MIELKMLDAEKQFEYFYQPDDLCFNIKNRTMELQDIQLKLKVHPEYPMFEPNVAFSLDVRMQLTRERPALLVPAAGRDDEHRRTHGERLEAL